MPSSPFASRSTRHHLVRGAAGLLALVMAALGAAAGVPVALALLVVTVVAWRGCPTCWALGLAQTVSRGRVGCADGSCAR